MYNNITLTSTNIVNAYKHTYSVFKNKPLNILNLRNFVFLYILSNASSKNKMWVGRGKVKGE